MKFELENLKNSVAVVTLDGTVDVMSCQFLRQNLCNAMSQGITRLILNLQAVKMMDNSAINTLRDCLKLFRERGGELALVNVTHQIDMKLHLLCLETVFPIYPNIQVALTRM